MNRRQVIVGTAAFMTAAVVPVAASTPDYASVADIGPRAYGPGCRMYNDHGVYEIQWSRFYTITPKRFDVIAGPNPPELSVRPDIEHLFKSGKTEEYFQAYDKWRSFDPFHKWLRTLRMGHDVTSPIEGRVIIAKGEYRFS